MSLAVTAGAFSPGEAQQRLRDLERVIQPRCGLGDRVVLGHGHERRAGDLAGHRRQLVVEHCDAVVKQRRGSVDPQATLDPPSSGASDPPPRVSMPRSDPAHGDRCRESVPSGRRTSEAKRGSCRACPTARGRRRARRGDARMRRRAVRGSRRSSSRQARPAADQPGADRGRSRSPARRRFPSPGRKGCPSQIRLRPCPGPSKPIQL